MKNKHIIHAYEPVRPDEIAKKRMLSNILSEKSGKSFETNPKRKSLLRKWLPAACVAAVLLCALAVPKWMDLSASSQFVQVTPGADSPNGIRKYMNYGGNRYVYLENGAVYEIGEKELSKAIGTLTYDIQANPEDYHAEDFAATFGVGGTVYQIDAYDPEFRVAVEINGDFYLCENVGIVNGDPIDVKTYFETADFAETVNGIEVCDHAGNTVLTEISGQDTKKMINILTQVTPADLTDEQYQQIGQAQRNGESFQLMFQLKDHTVYKMYVIPSLSIAMVGDNRYFLTDEFDKMFGELFSNLKQGAVPMNEQPHF